MGADGGVTLQQFPSKAVEAYGETEFARLDRKLAMFRSLSEQDRDLLPEFETRISTMAECLDVNARLLSAMAASAQGIASASRSELAATDASTTSIADTSTSSPSRSPHAGGNPQAPGASSSSSAPASSSAHAAAANGNHDDSLPTADADDELLIEDFVGEEDEKSMLSRSVRRGFGLLATDWSTAGESERDRIYKPIVNAVESAFDEASRAARSLQRDSFRVLVPGAGTGRLAWELARKGFIVEGCEMSFTALLVGNYVMNTADVNEAVEFFPYVHEHSNMRSVQSAARAVRVPDVNPRDIPASADFAIRAGEFVQAYEGQDNVWDAVASYLAFDVGEGCLEHVRRVAHILKPGGVWVVVGPTPCVDGAQGDGVHVSAEEFIEMIRKCGFKIVKQELMKSLYSVDDNSLRTVHIECPFVVAVKVRPIA